MVSPKRAGRRGFTLLEIVMVLLIGAILVSVLAAGYASIMQSMALTTSADLIRDIFSEARADAVAQNLNVEVRIYDLAPSTGGTPCYCALQIHSLLANGTTPALDKIQFLPQGAAIDATPTYSTLIGANAKAATVDPGDPHLDAQTRVFHFVPGGATDLEPTASWFLTVRAATSSDPAHFPANWACIRVDPTTGRAQLYRP